MVEYGNFANVVSPIWRLHSEKRTTTVVYCLHKTIVVGLFIAKIKMLKKKLKAERNTNRSFVAKKKRPTVMVFFINTYIHSTQPNSIQIFTFYGASNGQFVCERDRDHVPLCIFFFFFFLKLRKKTKHTESRKRWPLHRFCTDRRWLDLSSHQTNHNIISKIYTRNSMPGCLPFQY